MKTRYLLLALVLLITFAGGFIVGELFSTNNVKEEPLKTKQAPFSVKMLEPKAKPRWRHEKPKVLIGYVQDFRNPEDFDYSKLTHIIFSFAHPTEDGRIILNGDPALNNLRMLVSKAHQHNTKVILAVGGWYHINGGESYPYFKTAITAPESRSKLVSELVGIVEREKLDGIDIDFEHPRSQADAQNLAIFTNELSNKLHANNKELSIAVNSKIHSVAGTEITSVIYEPSMFQDVDYVNIMAYDGQWDGEYNAANLSPYPFTENVVTYWTNLFNAQKLPLEKLVLGVPSYAQPEDPAIKQISYATIISSDPANAGQDTVNLNGTTYHYNGDATIQRKTNLALDHGFGGMMLWELGQDSHGVNSLTGTILDVLNGSR